MSIDIDQLGGTVELESERAVGAALASQAALLAHFGVCPLTVLMAELDAHVAEKHGRVPDTPTWEEVLAAWQAHHGSASAAATAE